MKATENPIYVFLSLVRGNWRNAVYLSCQTCAYEENCGGFLMTADTEGIPVLISVDAFEKATGERIDKTECTAMMRRETFESVYNRWLLWHVTDKKKCALRQVSDTAQRMI